MWQLFINQIDFYHFGYEDLLIFLLRCNEEVPMSMVDSHAWFHRPYPCSVCFHRYIKKENKQFFFYSFKSIQSSKKRQIYFFEWKIKYIFLWLFISHFSYSTWHFKISILFLNSELINLLINCDFEDGYWRSHNWRSCDTLHVQSETGLEVWRSIEGNVRSEILTTFFLQFLILLNLLQRYNATKR